MKEPNDQKSTSEDDHIKAIYFVTAKIMVGRQTEGSHKGNDGFASRIKADGNTTSYWWVTSAELAKRQDMRDGITISYIRKMKTVFYLIDV